MSNAEIIMREIKPEINSDCSAIFSANAEKRTNAIAHLGKGKIYSDLYDIAYNGRDFNTIRKLLDKNISLCDANIYTEKCVSMCFNFYNSNDEALSCNELNQKKSNPKVNKLLADHIAHYSKRNDYLRTLNNMTVIQNSYNNLTNIDAIGSRTYIENYGNNIKKFENIKNMSWLYDLVFDIKKTNVVDKILDLVKAKIANNSNYKLIVTTKVENWCYKVTRQGCMILEKDLVVLYNAKNKKTIFESLIELELGEVIWRGFGNFNKPFSAKDNSQYNKLDEAISKVTKSFYSLIDGMEPEQNLSGFDLYTKIKSDFWINNFVRTKNLLYSYFSKSAKAKLAEFDFISKFFEIYAKNDQSSEKLDFINNFIKAEINSYPSDQVKEMMSPIRDYYLEYIDPKVDYFTQNPSATVIDFEKSYCD
jgi:hypothetical protein